MTTLADLQAYAIQEAEQFGLPPNLFLWQINQESGFNPNPPIHTNPVTGNPIVGIGQFDTGTAAQFGFDPTDPFASLHGAAQYDAQLYGAYGNYQDMLAHYGTAFTPSSPASVNAAATAAINGSVGDAGVNFFTGTLNGILNLFGLGPGIPQAPAGSVITPQNRSAFSNMTPTINNNQRGSLLGVGNWVTRGTAIIVGLILLAGALYLFGSGKTPIVIKKALA